MPPLASSTYSIGGTFLSLGRAGAEGGRNHADENLTVESGINSVNAVPGPELLDFIKLRISVPGFYYIDLPEFAKIEDPPWHG